MLLEFKTKNYKCFKDEAVFSMMPAPKQKGLDYSLLTQAAGKKDHTALCSSVVYGANAAGKSNIVSAIQTFKSIVLQATDMIPNVLSWPLDNIAYKYLTNFCWVNLLALLIL